MTTDDSKAALAAAIDMVRSDDKAGGPRWYHPAAEVADAILAALARWTLVPNDDPQWDATDGAHPAWWRGDDHGYARGQAEIARLRAALDGVARLSDDPVDWEIYRTRMGTIARDVLGPSEPSRRIPGTRDDSG